MEWFKIKKKKKKKTTHPKKHEKPRSLLRVLYQQLKEKKVKETDVCDVCKNQDQHPICFSKPEAKMGYQTLNKIPKSAKKVTIHLLSELLFFQSPPITELFLLKCFNNSILCL